MDEPPALRPDPDRELLADLREEKPGAVERFFRRFWPVALAYARAPGRPGRPGRRSTRGSCS